MEYLKLTWAHKFFFAATFMVLSYCNPAKATTQIQDSIATLLEKEKNNDPEAQYHLGLAYSKGDRVSKDTKKAVEFFTKAAEEGNANAQVILGICYLNMTVDGLETGMTRAAERAYEIAIEKGIIRAEQRDYVVNQGNLGICYKDMKKAIELFTKAAEQENTDAQIILGLCYLMGDGVVKDGKKAVELFTKAADQRNAVAQYNLGLCYINGDGIEADRTKGVNFLQEAADQGYPLAQQMLDVLRTKDCLA